jgi:ketosteroid isomerase-like protein
MAEDEIAERVKRALAAEDLSAFIELLDPDVTWGAPGARNPACKNREQVLAWYQRGREAGIRGSVLDVANLGDRLLVSMTVRGTDNAQERGGAAHRFQMLTVHNGRIVDIVGFDDKLEALAYVSQRTDADPS